MWGQTFAKMSGMLDLPRDEKAKHLLPMWLRNRAKRHNGIGPNLSLSLVDIAIKTEIRYNMYR